MIYSYRMHLSENVGTNLLSYTFQDYKFQRNAQKESGVCRGITIVEKKLGRFNGPSGIYDLLGDSGIAIATNELPEPQY